MKTTLSTVGEIMLPARLLRQDGLRPGQQFEIKRIRSGEYLLKALSSQSTPSLIAWLHACPERNWFMQVRTESTVDL